MAGGGWQEAAAVGGTSNSSSTSSSVLESKTSLVTCHLNAGGGLLRRRRGGETCILNSSAGGLSTNGANRKIGRPGGVSLCDETNQTVGVRGALFGYFLGKQKVTKSRRHQLKSDYFRTALVTYHMPLSSI